MFTKLFCPMANPYFLQGEKTVALLGNPYGLKCYRRKTSWFAFAIVALAHLSTVVAFRSQPQSVVPQTPPKPIMVSLVSEQPSMNNTPNLPSPPNQADQKPIKPKSKATKPNKIPHKAAKIIWPKERRVVEQKPSDQISTSEIKSKPLEKNVDISDKNAHTQGNSKPSNAEEKFQAPSFNAEYLNN